MSVVVRSEEQKGVGCWQKMCAAAVLGAVVLGVLSHLAFLPLLPYLHRGLTE